MQEKNARQQVLRYLSNQKDAFFLAHGQTREETLSEEETISDIVREHMESVNKLGFDSVYSLERACTRSPGITKFVPPTDDEDETQAHNDADYIEW